MLSLVIAATIISIIPNNDIAIDNSIKVKPLLSLIKPPISNNTAISH
jgi:hypothetical protein